MKVMDGRASIAQYDYQGKNLSPRLGGPQIDRKKIRKYSQPTQVL